jgi:hypothetical protein
MKKISLWGLAAVVALGFITYLLASQMSWATDGTRKKIAFDPTNVGAPGDELSDMLPDRPGHDRDRDRTPDNVVDEVNDGTPDCTGNFSGAGGDRRNACSGNSIGNIDSGDGIPENHFGDDQGTFTFPDGTSVRDGVPDDTRYMKIDRALEYAADYSPDWVNSDTYLARVGKKTSVGDGDPDGGRNSGYGIDAGPGGTDMRPHDGVNDRIDVAGSSSDTGRPHYASGPGDKKNDESSDEGGLATRIGGSGGGGGCSMVASREVSSGSGLAYLLVMLAPAALVVIRRRLRK